MLLYVVEYQYLETSYVIGIFDTKEKAESLKQRQKSYNIDYCFISEMEINSINKETISNLLLNE